jgi:hypothetical protein
MEAPSPAAEPLPMSLLTASTQQPACVTCATLRVLPSAASRRMRFPLRSTIHIAFASAIGLLSAAWAGHPRAAPGQGTEEQEPWIILQERPGVQEAGRDGRGGRGQAGGGSGRAGAGGRALRH